MIPFFTVLGSGSGTVINYGSGSDFTARYGSGSASHKVTVPTVLVPVPQRCPSHRILAHIRGRSWSMVSQDRHLFVTPGY